jgi:Spy/CpxP family protein refolding chaperone
MIRGRARAALVIGAIVIGSVLAGAALDRAILVRQPHRPRGMATPEQDARRRQGALDRMTKELDLSTTQRAAIDSIMQRTDSSLRLIRREMQPRLKQVFESSRAQIESRLDPEQRVKFARSRSKARR